MKINWGTGLAIAMIAFMLFIVSFVYKTFTDKSYDHHLVSEEYYKDEINYQQEIDAVANANKLPINVGLKKVDNGIVVFFPKSIASVSGTISFQRPSNVALDFEIPISIKNNQVLIPKEKLVKGVYNVRVKWLGNNTNYLLKENFVY